MLFEGIAFSACGISLNAEMLHVIKEFVEGAADRLAAGYAVAYPLSVIGMILTCILLGLFCHIDLSKEPTNLSDITTLNSRLPKREVPTPYRILSIP